MTHKGPYVVAEWPDAVMLRILPNNHGYIWPIASGGGRRVTREWHHNKSLFWKKKLEDDVGVVFAYTLKNEGNLRHSIPQIVFSLERFPQFVRVKFGTGFMVDEIALHPALLAKQQPLEPALGRIRWFLFDVLGLDIEYDIPTVINRELFIPLVANSEYMEELDKDISSHQGKARNMLQHFIAPGLDKLILMKTSDDNETTFIVTEKGSSLVLGKSEDPLTALINADVIIPADRVDEWIDANTDPGTEPIDTRIYQALKTDPPCLWRNKQFLDYIESLESQ